VGAGRVAGARESARRGGGRALGGGGGGGGGVTRWSRLGRHTGNSVRRGNGRRGRGGAVPDGNRL
ncbi:MAG: hypothetical protein OXF01_00175, partial [Gemmatimonadetes bacterium]|nr:hypothetical protein [Gemmatimonadota bacterium]